MPVSNQLVINWYYDKKGKLTYSMTGSRNGSDGTADCSGSITQAIKEAGGVMYAYLYSTVTLSGYLAQNNYGRVAINNRNNLQLGDIIMMSWGKDMSVSGGAGGHVGVMTSNSNFISVDYWTGGAFGTAVSEHDLNYYLNYNKPQYFEVWRLQDNSSNNETTTNNIQTTTSNDVDYMLQYGYVQWNQKSFAVDDSGFVNSLWQVVSNELSDLVPTSTTSDQEWLLNGVPMTGITWTDGTNSNSVSGKSFKFDQDVMSIVDYDTPTNGICVLVSGFQVWVDATVAKKA